MYWNLEILYCDRDVIHIGKVHNDNLPAILKTYSGGCVSIKLTKYYL